MSCDAELRGELLANIVLSGAAATMPGLADRLTIEVDKLVAAAAERLGGVHALLCVHVSAPPPSGAPPADAASGGEAPADSTEPNALYDQLAQGGMEAGYLAGHAQAVKRAATAMWEHSAWLGGSCLASDPPCPQGWITAREYLTSRPAVAHSKCL